jgi:hypothetical protein
MNSAMKTTNSPLLLSQRIAQVCLFLFAGIALSGGTLQLYLGQPDTTPRLDNIHRFLAGVYLACGFICFWTAWTVRQQNALVFLIALAGLFGATGRLISMARVGIPAPNEVWIGYVTVEIVVPAIIIVSQLVTNQKLKKNF